MFAGPSLLEYISTTAQQTEAEQYASTPSDIAKIEECVKLEIAFFALVFRGIYKNNLLKNLPYFSFTRCTNI